MDRMCMICGSVKQNEDTGECEAGHYKWVDKDSSSEDFITASVNLGLDSEDLKVILNAEI